MLGAIPASASSAIAPVTGTTSMTNVPDTTNGAGGGACVTSPNGPSWATDQFPTVTLSAVEETTPADTWNVTITSDGSFVGFADPLTCTALVSSGNVVGSIQYTVTSATPPSASGLKSDYSGATEFSTLIDDFFADSPTISGGDVYDYSYQGGNYTQVGTEGGGLIVTGDVVAGTGAASPTPTPSSSTGSHQATTPVGGVQTGGGLPRNNPLVPIGAGVAAVGLALCGTALARRRQRG